MAALVPGEKARMYALGKLARGGATRGGYHSNLPFISIGGVQQGTGRTDKTKGVLVESLSVRDTLDDVPNTCQFTTKGFVPTMGQDIVITLGTMNSLTRWFAGVHLSHEQKYLVDNPANTVYACNGIDYHWLLGLHNVLKRYTGWMAGAIIRDLVASFAEGFTTSHVATALDSLLIDEITFTSTALADAITQVCKRVGAYWYTDYFKDVHAFTVPEPFINDPTPLTPTHPSLRDVSMQRDLSQMLTRAIVEGGGGMASVDVAAGETLLPVDTPAWYPASGGIVASGPQRMKYTSLLQGGGGTLVGPGAGPTAAPGVTPLAGGVLSNATYQWAYTHVTAAGESKPSPVAQGAASTVANPTLAPAPVQDAASTGIYQNMFPVGSTVQLCIVYVTPEGTVTASGPVAAPFTVLQHATMGPAYGQGLYVNVACSQDPRVANIYIYAQCSAFGATYRQLWSVANQLALGGQGNVLGTRPYRSDAFASWPALSGVNNTAQNQFRIDGIAVGQATVTARKLYRTGANQSQLKLVTTLADNTTTTYTDNIPDVSLGANAPASDTSGLQMPSGSVAAGSTSLIIAGAGAFSSSGGFAVIGNGEQTIRYTGIGGGALTGIPASGPGSITAAVSYNSTVTAAAVLAGIPASGPDAIKYAIKEGDNVNVVVITDNPLGISALQSYIGGSGIKETYIQDGRIGYVEAGARGTAALQQRAALGLACQYSVRDPNTRSGRTIHIALTAPFVVTADLKIQDVTISKFSAVPNLPPLFTVSASSDRYAFEDLLRVARDSIIGGTGA